MKSLLEAGAHFGHQTRRWDPRMRLAIFAHLEAGGAGLEPLVRQAIEQLRDKASSH